MRDLDQVGRCLRAQVRRGERGWLVEFPVKAEVSEAGRASAVDSAVAAVQAVLMEEAVLAGVEPDR